MDREQHRDAQARLESDYLAGAISAEEYTRLRHALHQSLTGFDEQSDPARTPQRGVDSVTGLRLAGWGGRAAALVVDWVILSVLIYAVLIVDVLTANAITEGSVGLVILGVPPVYTWLMVGRFGQTLGKMAVGVRVVRAENAGRVGYARAAGRSAAVAVLAFLFFLPLVLAWLWPLWDARNQTLYDKIARTIVVRA